MRERALLVAGRSGEQPHAPGRDCIGCHTATQHGPRFTVAGTLYNAGHEVDECLGYDSDVQAGQSAEALAYLQGFARLQRLPHTLRDDHAVGRVARTGDRAPMRTLRTSVARREVNQ